MSESPSWSLATRQASRLSLSPQPVPPAKASRRQRSSLAAALLVFPLLAGLVSEANAQTKTVSLNVPNTVTVAEGNSGHTDHVINVMLSESYTETLPIRFTYKFCLSSGSDTGSTRGTTADWQLIEPIPLTGDCRHNNVPRGLTSSLGPYHLRIYGDTVDEPDGTITVTLQPPTSSFTAFGWTLGTSMATYTIRDDDPTVVTLARSNTGELTEGGSRKAEFQVTLGRELIAGERIDVPLAMSGTDVTAADVENLAKRADKANVGVTVRNAGTLTPTVSFEGAGAQTATLFIAASTDGASEGGGKGYETMTVALAADATFDADVDTNVGGGADPHGTTKDFSVRIHDDTAMGAEVTLASTVPADNTMTERVPGDAAMVKLDLGRALVDGETSTLAIKLTGSAVQVEELDNNNPVTRTKYNPASNQFSVSSAGDGVTHARSGENLTLTFTGSDQDTVREAILTFTPTNTFNGIGHDGVLTVSVDATGSTANFGGGLTIKVPMKKAIRFLDSENKARVGFAQATPGFAEGDGDGTHTITVPITLSKKRDYPVHVWVSAADGTAVAGNEPGEDYVNDGPWQVTIPAGDTQADLDIDVHADWIDEDDEDFTLSIDPARLPAGVVLARRQATVTIRDDDGAWISINSPNPYVAENGGSTSISHKLSSRPTHDVVITLSSPDTSALLVAPPGGTGGSSASVTVTPDRWYQHHADHVVTVTGVDNNTQDATTRVVTLQRTVTSKDPKYHNLIRTSDELIAIGDDEGTVSLEFTSATFGGRNESSSNLIVSPVLALSRAYGEDIDVSYTLSGTATAGSDYAGTATTRTFTIPAGAERFFFDLTLLDDNLLEGDETIILTIDDSTFTPTHVTKDSDPLLTATITIRDDEATRLNKDTEEQEIVTTVRLAAPGGRKVLEGESFEFTVTLSHALDAGKRLDVPLVIPRGRGTAEQSDYRDGWTLKPGGGLNAGVRLEDAGTQTPTVVFEGGARVATLLLNTWDDTQTEIDELFPLALGDQTAFDADADSTVPARPASTGELILTILDNEYHIYFIEQLSDKLADEDIGFARIEIGVSGRVPRDVELYLHYENKNATTTADYTKVHDLKDPITVPAGNCNLTPKPDACLITLFIPIINDTENEADDPIRITLIPEHRSDQKLSTLDLIILDDDPKVTITALASQVTEGSAARFRLARTVAERVPLDVQLSVQEQDGNFVDASEEGTRTVSIPANAASIDFSIPTQADANAEGRDSTLTVGVGEQNLFRNCVPGPPNLDDPDAVVDDDCTLHHRFGTVKSASVELRDAVATPTVNLSAGAFSVTEGSPVKGEVRLSRALREGVTIHLVYTDRTATALSDYTAVPSVRIPSGQTKAAFSIATKGNADRTGAKTFVLGVDAAKLPAGLAAGETASATVTIGDDEAGITANVDLATAATLPEGATARFAFRYRDTNGQKHAVRRDDVAEIPLSIGGTATLGTDYRLVCGQNAEITCRGLDTASPVLTVTGSLFEANKDGADSRNVLHVVALEDGTDEATSETVTITSSHNTATVTLVDAPDAVTVSMVRSTFAIREDESSLQPVVTITPAAGRELIVPFTYTDGTATAGADYRATPTVRVPAGHPRFTFGIPIIDDEAFEDDETFTVAIDAAKLSAWATVAADGIAASTATIRDNDAEITAFITPVFVMGGHDIPEGAVIPFHFIMSDQPRAGSIWTFPITFGGAATRGTDYTLSCKSEPGVVCLNLNSGNASIVVTVDELARPPSGFGSYRIDELLTLTVVEDNTVESGESISIALNDRTWSQMLGDAPSAVELEWSKTAYTTTEGSGPLQPVIRLDKPSGEDITLNLTYTDGTARRGVEYFPEADTIVIPAGRITSNWDIDKPRLVKREPKKTFVISVDTSTLPSGVTFLVPDAAVTILDRQRDIEPMLEGMNSVEDLIPEGVTQRLTLKGMTGSNFGGIYEYRIVTRGDAERSGADADYALQCGGHAKVTCRGLSGATPTLTVDTDGWSGVYEDVLRLVAAADSLAEPDGDTLTVQLVPTHPNDDSSNLYAARIIDPPESVEVEFAAAGVSAKEEDGTIEVTLTVTPPSATALSIPLTTTDVTATAGVDYQSVPASVSIPAGAARHSFRIALNDDGDYEGSGESFTIELDAGKLPSGVTAGDTALVTVTIREDEQAITAVRLVSTISVVASAFPEGATADVAIILSRPMRAGEVRTFKVRLGGEATYGDDYRLACGAATGVSCAGFGTANPTITLSADNLADRREYTVKHAFTLTALDDGETEPGGETVSVQLNGGGVYELRIVDPPGVVNIQFSKREFTTSEGNGPFQPVILINPPPPRQLDIPIRITHITTDDRDFNSSTDSFTIKAGTRSSHIDIDIKRDRIYESDEAIFIEFDTANFPKGVRVKSGEPSRAKVTFLDRDNVGIRFAEPRFEFSRGERVEVGITLTQPSPADLNLWVTDRPKGGTRKGVDYSGGPWMVPIAKGELTGTLRFDTASADSSEQDRSLALRIPGGGLPSWTETAGAMADVDILVRYEARLVHERISVAEGQPAEIDVELSFTPNAPLTLELVEAAGDATSGTDYDAGPYSVTFAAGQKRARLSIPTADDAEPESDETFTVTLTAKSLPERAVLGALVSTTVRILDDESTRMRAVIEGESATLTEGGEPGALTLIVVSTDTGNGYLDLTLGLGGDATPGEDYTVGINHGGGFEPLTVHYPPEGASLHLTTKEGRNPLRIVPTDDDEGEPDETVEVFFRSYTYIDGNTGSKHPPELAAVEGRVALTLSDGGDGGMPVVSVSGGPPVREGGTATFTVRADPVPETELTVHLRISQNSEFVEAAALGGTTLTFDPQTLSMELAVQTVADDVEEADGAVVATVLPGTGYTVAANDDGGEARIAVQDAQSRVPVVRFASATGRTGEGADWPYDVTVEASPAPESDIVVAWEVSGGTATWGREGTEPGADFTMRRPGAVEILAAANPEGHVSARIVDDAKNEGDETSVFTLLPGEGYRLGDRATHRLTIADNDAGKPRVSPSLDTTIFEGETLTFTVSGIGSEHVSVDLVNATWGIELNFPNAAAFDTDGNEAAGADYQVLTADGTVLALSSSAMTPVAGRVTFRVRALADADDTEGDETIHLVMEGREGPPLHAELGTLTLADGARGSSSSARSGEPAESPEASGAFVPDATLVAEVTAKADNHPNPDAAARLRRVVKGMTGESGGYTSAECREVAAEYGVSGTWQPWCDEIERRETHEANAALPPPSSVPEIGIAGEADVIEGEDAVFTVTTSPAPTNDLVVSLDAEETHGSGADAISIAGIQEVTIPAGETSATYTHATHDDETDLGGGSLSVTVLDGDGYVVSSTEDAVTVAVVDDDVPCVSERLHGTVRQYHANAHKADQQARWAAVLQAFGNDVGVTAMTAAEAQAYHDRGPAWQAKWAGIPDAIACREPAGLSIGDARVQEGGTLTFRVSLSKAAAETVRVSYATRSGTATDGVDYTGASGTLTFESDEREHVLSVATLDDTHDEGEETFTVVLSGAQGATLADAEATGTIVNSDPMPQAWLARFGRTLGEQALDGVAARLADARTPGLMGSLGGGGLTGAGQTGPGTWDQTGPGPPWAPNQPLDAAQPPGAGGQARSLQDLLRGSHFALTGKSNAYGGSLAFWGRGAYTSFTGQAGSLTLDGEVTTGLLGADYATGPWLLGVALSQSAGTGRYGDPDVAAGSIEASLTAALPYAAWQPSDRLSLWGTAGYGGGTVTLTPETSATADVVGDPMATDVTWTMAATGLRGSLLDSPASDGPLLTLVSDALWTRTTSDRTSDMKASTADVTRLRFGLEGRWPVSLAHGGSLTPKLELGARHDDGDAETGFGLELGGGLTGQAPAYGLALDLAARSLLAHADQAFETWGASAQLTWDPDPATTEGPTLTVRQAYGGAATGGVAALFAPGPLPLATGPTPNTLNLTAEAGWGIALGRGSGIGVPHVGYGWTPTSRDVTVGWRLTPTPAVGASNRAGFFTFRNLTLDLLATRRTALGTAPVHGVQLSLTRSW